MTDNQKPAACPDEGRAPARFYGFADTRTIPESLAALKALEETACTEILAGGEAECAPSASIEPIYVPGDKDVPSPRVQAVIEAIIALPPVDSSKPKPSSAKKHASPKTKKRKRPKPVVEEAPVPPLTMHEAHCKICSSNLREELDEEFVDWHSVATIANAYRFDRHAVYRHAHATGLFAIRDRNLRRALGLIIHRAETARNITGDTVIRAVRTLAHINDSGEWVNPPTHVIVSSGAALHADANAPSTPELLDTPVRVKNELKP